MADKFVFLKDGGETFVAIVPENIHVETGDKVVCEEYRHDVYSVISGEFEIKDDSVKKLWEDMFGDILTVRTKVEHGENIDNITYECGKLVVLLTDDKRVFLGFVPDAMYVLFGDRVKCMTGESATCGSPMFYATDDELEYVWGPNTNFFLNVIGGAQHGKGD